MTRIALVACLAACAALASLAPRAAAQPVDEAQAMRDFFTGVLEIDVPAGNWSAKRGHWDIENGRICTTANRPLGDERAAKYCNLGLGKHIGDMWRDSDPVTDNTVLFRLSPGRL